MRPPAEGDLSKDDITALGMKLLQTADEAMYASKSRGKNVVTVAPFVADLS